MTDTATITNWASGSTGTVTASYSGGAYIELGFGGRHPTEVINVWDHAAGEPRGEFHRWDTLTPTDRRHALTFEVHDWIRSLHEEGWDSWYLDYLTNVR